MIKLQRYELAGTYDDDVRLRDDGRCCAPSTSICYEVHGSVINQIGRINNES